MFLFKYLLDIQFFEMNDCFDNIIKFFFELVIYVNWIVLIFVDFVGKLIRIFINYFQNSYNFFWRDFRVQYVVFKFFNGMRISCVFILKI